MNENEHEEEEETISKTSPYKVFAEEWKILHQETIQSLNYMEIIRYIAVKWALMTPNEKLKYYKISGVPKTIPIITKKKKPSTLKPSDDDEFGKRSIRKKSKSSKQTTSDSSDSDAFVQEKRKYRKRKKRGRQ